jgi:hypothetical protein
MSRPRSKPGTGSYSGVFPGRGSGYLSDDKKGLSCEQLVDNIAICV